MIAVGKMENGFVSRYTISHKAAVASLSHRWSVIRPHPVRRRKGRMCIVSPFDSAEAEHPDLRYMPFSLTKLRRGRAYATCSLAQYGQIPPAAAHLVTSRRPPGIPSGLAPLPSSHVATCGSSIVLCPKCSSSGVLSILQSRPHTVLDKHNRVVILP